MSPKRALGCFVRPQNRLPEDFSVKEAGMIPRFYRLTVMALMLVVAAAWAAPNLMFDGKVVSAAKDKLVLSAGTEQLEFALTSTTKITLDGKPATPAELMAGHMAKVSAERDETKLKALAIDAITPK
jgi:hypothetical protein